MYAASRRVALFGVVSMSKSRTETIPKHTKQCLKWIWGIQ
jgi:hypothetical protein